MIILINIDCTYFVHSAVTVMLIFSSGHFFSIRKGFNLHSGTFSDHVPLFWQMAEADPIRR